MIKLQPCLVLLRVDPVVEQAAEGYYIQEEWQELPPTGTVEAVGKEVKFCKKGDRVFFSRYGAVPFPNDATLRVCRDDEVFAVL